MIFSISLFISTFIFSSLMSFTFNIKKPPGIVIGFVNSPFLIVNNSALIIGEIALSFIQPISPPFLKTQKYHKLKQYFQTHYHLLTV